MKLKLPARRLIRVHAWRQVRTSTHYKLSEDTMSELRFGPDIRYPRSCPGNAVAEDATVKFTRGPVKVTNEIRRLRPVMASAIVLSH